MRQFTFVVVLLMLASASPAWSQTQSDIPGDWNVTKVVVSDRSGEIAPDIIKKVETLFMQTQFHFRADGVAVIDSPQKALQFKKSLWTFDEKEKSISVNGTDMAGKEGLLLKLFVKVQDTKWFFDVNDAPIQLEVQKSIKK